MYMTTSLSFRYVDISEKSLNLAQVRVLCGDSGCCGFFFFTLSQFFFIIPFLFIPLSHLHTFPSKLETVWMGILYIYIYWAWAFPFSFSLVLFTVYTLIDVIDEVQRTTCVILRTQLSYTRAHIFISFSSSKYQRHTLWRD